MDKVVVHKFFVGVADRKTDYVPVEELDVNKKYEVDKTFVIQDNTFNNVLVFSHYVTEI